MSAMVIPFLFVLIVAGVEGFFVNPSVTHPARLSSTTTTTTLMATTPPQRVVIVGGGIGGLSTAFDARRILQKDDKVTVVSDRAHFEFTPSNPWVAVHKRTPQEIMLDLETILPRHGIDFVHAQATQLDAKEKVLTVQSTDDDGEGEAVLKYDYLIIATGPRLGFEEIPGLDELHSDKSTPPHDENSVVSVCTTDHATHASEAADRLVQNPGPVVVGATQGASCFGPLYEYALLLQHYLRKRGGRTLLNQCPISLVTPEPFIGHLGLKGAGQSNQILTNLLEQKQIEWYTNCKVTEVTRQGVAIEYHERQKEGREGAAATPTETKTKFLPSKLTMLIPPFRGMKLWQQVPGLTDQNGMILVDRHQQSIAYPDIFGVGVCVHLDPVEDTLVPTGPPKTGYMIESMGTACVKNIQSLIYNTGNEESNTISKKPLIHTPKLNGLCITDFGDDGAIFLTLPQMPPRRTDVTIEGKIGTMAKMAFEKYFLFKIQTGDTDPYYEKHLLHLIGVDRVEKDKTESPSTT